MHIQFTAQQLLGQQIYTQLRSWSSALWLNRVISPWGLELCVWQLLTTNQFTNSETNGYCIEINKLFHTQHPPTDLCVKNELLNASVSLS